LLYLFDAHIIKVYIDVQDMIQNYYRISTKSQKHKYINNTHVHRPIPKRQGQISPITRSPDHQSKGGGSAIRGSEIRDTKSSIIDGGKERGWCLLGPYKPYLS
jgi:hypothetical protein